ncbi:ATPase AAA [Amycolatopsis sp. NBRC 101858]|uniref:ATP-binding protein n=1 Tax=Amycolatopsis sp. NBRC 101858 TaxID=3032200 RepID=UPI0024A04219|nr:ATP-binding protein [Amycolatopsis sp. NBRC 101858]GLY37802.1 ATPase AAA [Amycolatopsis sp. NBRC 101858]
MTAREYANCGEHLADELHRLDLLIGTRLKAVDAADGAGQVNRAMYVTRQEVESLLGGEAADPVPDRSGLAEFTAHVAARVAASDGVLPLPELGRIFGLSALELDAVLICLAPELRRKYDRLYAYLQDDITRQRPSVDLVLDLVCAGERERWAAQAVFDDSAPLLRSGILRPVEDPHSPSGSSGLGRFLALDPRITRFLLGTAGLDARLAGHARLYPATGLEAGPRPEAGLADRMVRLGEHRPVVFYLQGQAGSGKRALAMRCAERLGVPLVSVDGASLGDDVSLLRLALREGLLHGAAVHVAGADTLSRAALMPALAGHQGLVVLSGESEWPPGDAVVPLAVPLPDLARSTDIWRACLAGCGPEAESWAGELAGRYRLPAGRIPAVVRLARDNRLMAPEPGPLRLADVSAACRQQSARTLGGVAVKMTATARWDDLVLPADQVAVLHEIRDQFDHRHQVLESWGFGAKLARGKGLSALFSGPPGTGKTMAAEVLAVDLGLDVYQVDLSQVVSKYIGETEKNLAKIFDEARTGNAILFFDEADALFGKRTEVSDAHDRYANIETSYLLQKMDEYDGVVVLASNLRQNLDEAFTRRLRFVVEFPFPEADSRRRIWRAVFPAEAPLAADVDFAELAGHFTISGGNIKNIALNAAFLAAVDKSEIGRRHVLSATRREFEKMGKVWTEPTLPG